MRTEKIYIWWRGKADSSVSGQHTGLDGGKNQSNCVAESIIWGAVERMTDLNGEVKSLRCL